MVDHLQGRDSVVELFGANQMDFRTALQNPYVPEFVRTSISDLINNIKLLSNGNLLEAVRPALKNLPHTTQVMEDAYINIVTNGGIYMPTSLEEPGGTIIFNLDKLQRQNTDSLHLRAPVYIARALGHGTGVRRRSPLQETTNNSTIITPFQTVDQAVQDLNDFRTKFHNREGNLQKEDFDVIMRGFTTHYIERGSGLEYPPDNRLVNYDVARTAILGTLYLIFFYGSRHKPFSSPEDQINVGWQKVLTNAAHDMTTFKREYESLKYIIKFLGDKHIDRDDFAKLFDSLSNKTIDEFREDPANQFSVFEQISEEISPDPSSRPASNLN